ncbi:MAG: orotidine-5'-phosphate decarboxylase [Puniceicoccaceae bacterium]
MAPTTEIALALDVPNRDRADDVLLQLAGGLQWVKIGLQLFCREGPAWIAGISQRGFKVFLDLKLHDIPNTVAGAVSSIASCRPDLLTLHASGGEAMLRAAVEARNSHTPSTRLIAVSVLTSLDQADLASIGVPDSTEEQVLRLTKLALSAGVDGVVASPLEIALLRSTFGPQPYLVTPGIRPESSQAHEQKRTMGPAQAAAAGSNLLVVGRPILEAPNPRAALESIQSGIDAIHPRRT